MNDRSSPSSATLSIGVLALAVCAFLFEGLWLDRALLSVDPNLFPPFIVHAEEDAPARAMNFATTDINGYVMPETRAMVERLEEGALPLWNDRQNLGQPLLADLGYAPFYPTAVLYHLLEPLRAYAWSMALHLFALGLGTLLWLRRRGMTSSAAFIGTLTLVFAGFLTMRLHIPHFIRAAAWLPWIVIAFERQGELPSWRRVAAVACAVGGSLLAGFPQIGFLAVGLGGVLALARRMRPRGWVGAVVGIALGGAVSAIHLVPGAEMYRNSMRSDAPPPALSEAKQLEPECLLTWLSPHLLGTPVQTVAPGDSIRSLESFPTHRAWLTPDIQNNVVENTGYVGVLPLMLALSSLLLVRRRPWLLVPWAAGVSAVLAALGIPGFSDAVAHIPGLSSGSPKRLLFASTVACAVLAAAAWDAWMRRPTGGLRVAWAVGGLLCVVAAGELWTDLPLSHVPDVSEEDRAWFRQATRPDVIGLVVAACVLWATALLPRARRWMAALVVLAVAVDLVGFGRRNNPPQPLPDVRAEPPVIPWLREQGVDTSWRFMSFGGDEVLGGSMSQNFGLRSAHGISAMVDRETGQLLRTLEPQLIDPSDPRLVHSLGDIRSLASPLLDLMGVRFIATGFAGFQAIEAAAAEQPDAFAQVAQRVYASEAEYIAVYERLGALPRLSSPRTVRQAPQQLLELLGAPEFNPREVAYVDGPVNVPDRTDATTEPTITPVETPSGTLQAHVECEQPCLVLANSSHTSGWKVDVDGEATSLLRTNHAFLGTVVPAGTHTVTFRYAPSSFTFGAATSAGAALLIVFLCFIRQRRSDPLPSSPSMDSSSPGSLSRTT